MASSLERVREPAAREARLGSKDQSRLLRTLDTKQRKALSLFQESSEITLTVLLGILWWRTQRSADTAYSVIFEEEQTPEVASLGLFRDGYLPPQPRE